MLSSTDTTWITYTCFAVLNVNRDIRLSYTYVAVLYAVQISGSLYTCVVVLHAKLDYG